MSTEPNRQHLLRVYILSGLIIVVLTIFLFNSRPVYEDDAGQVGKVYYIKTEKDESWISKLLNDPTALFTMVLTCATIGLFFVTNRLAELAEDQGKITNDLFSKDQRPWIKLDIINNGIIIDKGRSVISVTARVKNVGKSPAFNVAILPSELIMKVITPEIKGRTRNGTLTLARVGGSTLFPGDEDTLGFSFKGEELFKKDVLTLFFVCCTYKNWLTNEVCETSYGCSIGVNADGTAFVSSFRISETVT